MEKLRIADAEAEQVAIRREILRSGESRYDHRLHGLLLIKAGLTTAQVANVLGEDRRTIQRWVGAFEKNGVAGLRGCRPPGRPRSLSPDQMSRLGKDLRRRPWTFGYAAGAWDGKLLSEHLRRKYRVKLGVRQSQRLLKRLGSDFRVRHRAPRESASEPGVAQ